MPGGRKPVGKRKFSEKLHRARPLINAAQEDLDNNFRLR